MAQDGIGRATGPYSRNDPRYLDTWWERICGSTPFFWNWQKQYQGEVRDGQPRLLIGDFGKFFTGQKRPITPEDGELVGKKVVQVRLKNYIEVGSVISSFIIST